MLAAPSRTHAGDPQRGRAVDLFLAARVIDTESTIVTMNAWAPGGRDCHAARKAWSVVATAQAIVAGQAATRLEGSRRDGSATPMNFVSRAPHID
jgi:hypothetical protein